MKPVPPNPVEVTTKKGAHKPIECYTLCGGGLNPVLVRPELNNPNADVQFMEKDNAIRRYIQQWLRLEGVGHRTTGHS